MNFHCLTVSTLLPVNIVFPCTSAFRHQRQLYIFCLFKYCQEMRLNLFLCHHAQNLKTSVSAISWKLRPVCILIDENSISYKYLTVWYRVFLCRCLSFLEYFAKILWFSNLSFMECFWVCYYVSADGLQTIILFLQSHFFLSRYSELSYSLF